MNQNRINLNAIFSPLDINCLNMRTSKVENRSEQTGVLQTILNGKLK